MSKRDYYEILGVSRICTEIELKAQIENYGLNPRPGSTTRIAIRETRNASTDSRK